VLSVERLPQRGKLSRFAGPFVALAFGSVAQG
jgi:hypothetical protein